MMPTETITLPWPDARLSPNGRYHWSKVSQAKKAAKRTAHYAVLEAKIGKIETDRVDIRYSFHPPDRRLYDLDNLVARMKASADGIANALNVNDRIFHPHVNPLQEVVKGGKVVVELTWIDKGSSNEDSI